MPKKTFRWLNSTGQMDDISINNLKILSGGLRMETNKICEFCKKPFESVNDKDHCPECTSLKTVQTFFDVEAGNLMDAIEKYPELHITDSVEWKNRDWPDRRYFLHPIIPEASITLVAGEDGSGKTMLKHIMYY